MLQKTCMAAAFSMAASCAWAQSSVSIYGIVEMNLARANSGTSAVANLAGNTARMDGLTSRLGFRGTEDLGGGHFAFFNLETRFKTDTGELTAPARFWEGRSVIGLRGSYGEVTAGRDYIPAFYPAVKTDPFGYDQTAGSILGHQFAGLRSNHTGFNVEYNSGPLYVGATADRTDSNNRLWLLAGSYDFKVVKLMGTYASSRRSPGVEGKNFTVGLTAPLGNGIAKIVYARFDPDKDRGSLNAGTSVGGATRSKIGVGYEHFAEQAHERVRGHRDG